MLVAGMLLAAIFVTASCSSMTSSRSLLSSAANRCPPTPEPLCCAPRFMPTRSPCANPEGFREDVLYYICRHYPEQLAPVGESGWTLKAGASGRCPVVWQAGDWTVTDEGDGFTIANAATGFQWEGFPSIGSNGCDTWAETRVTMSK